MIALDDQAFAVRGGQLLQWAASEYSSAKLRPCGVEVDVLTPPSILSVLSRGYVPLWHPSAGR
jgi:hypothetical protein